MPRVPRVWGEQLQSWWNCCTQRPQRPDAPQMHPVDPETHHVLHPSPPGTREHQVEALADKMREANRPLLVKLARLLLSKEDGELFGQTEFEVRNLVHLIGARAYETTPAGKKRLRGVQRDLPRLWTGGQVPGLSSQDADGPVGRGPPRAGLLLLRAVRPRAVPLGSDGRLDAQAPDAWGGAGGRPGRVAQRRLRRGGREGVPELAGLRQCESTAERTTEDAGARAGGNAGRGPHVGPARCPGTGTPTPKDGPAPMSAWTRRGCASRGRAAAGRRAGCRMWAWSTTRPRRSESPTGGRVGEDAGPLPVGAVQVGRTGIARRRAGQVRHGDGRRCGSA